MGNNDEEVPGYLDEPGFNMVHAMTAYEARRSTYHDDDDHPLLDCSTPLIPVSTVLPLLLSFPLFKLLGQMILELAEPVPEVLAASPAEQVTVQVALSPRMASRVVPIQWKIMQTHQEWRGEAVVVFPFLHAVANTVHREHMDVEMVHGRTGVDAADDVLVPIAPGR